MSNLFVHLFIYPSVYISICSSVHLFIRPSVHPFICSSFQVFMFPSICPSVYLFKCPSVCPRDLTSVYLLFVCPSVLLSVCLCTTLCFREMSWKFGQAGLFFKKQDKTEKKKLFTTKVEVLGGWEGGWEGRWASGWADIHTCRDKLMTRCETSTRTYQ